MISLGLLLRSAVLLVALAAANVTAWLTLDDLRRPADDLLPDLLAAGAAWLLQAALGWVLLTTLAVLVETLGAGVPRCSDRLGCPPAVRRAVLAACGIGLLGVASPALADDAAHEPPPAAAPVQVDLSGLALPDRLVPAPPRAVPPAVTRPVAAPAPRRERAAGVTVRAGDTLWSIAERRLGRTAPPARIAREVDRWVHANAASVSDPDLITPGQRLVAPATEES